MKKIFWLFIFLIGCSASTVPNDENYDDFQVGKYSSSSVSSGKIAIDGIYTSKWDVARYICQYDKLPANYVSKSEGMRLFEEKTGNTFSKWNFNPWTTLGVMIGGDSFSNAEKLLPDTLKWLEADVDYYAANRGTNRLVYGKNCQIYSTKDHYESFEKLDLNN